jgi:aspartate-semialdehyde dehydrogenase
MRGLTVQDASDVAGVKGRCSFVFSAVEMDKAEIARLEEAYAAAGVPVVSNNSAHRETRDVPVLIPEINYRHLDIIPIQRKARGWGRGFIVVKPNCSLQSYMTPVHALIDAGYPVDSMIITTMQAVSGAGYPGVPSYDIVGNVVPFIKDEEEKSENEPKKILGRIVGDVIVPDKTIRISAHCNRVPTIDGHLACVSLKFAGKKPQLDEIQEIWKRFVSAPQRYELPSAPKQPVFYIDEPDRPQPRLDSDRDKAMAVTIGRLRPCEVLGTKFVANSHNTVRGAAGGGILNAELLYHEGYLG